MSNYIENIEIAGLYGRFDLRQRFFPGINVLYGKNGSGKTTLLHILANALNGDFERFAYLTFEAVKLELDNEVVVVIEQNRKPVKSTGNVNDEYRVITKVQINEKPVATFQSTRTGDLSRSKVQSLTGAEAAEPLLPSAYFPAFRTIVEAWSSISVEEIDRIHLRKEEVEELQEMFDRSDNFTRDFTAAILDKANFVYRKLSPRERVGVARSLFGELVPKLNYLSVSEIQAKIVGKINNTKNIDSYDNDFEISEEVEEELEPFLTAVNNFLEGKTLAIYLSPSDYDSHFDLLSGRIPLHRSSSPLKLKFNDDGRYETLNALSSGERQIVMMLYAASQMSEHKVILIDEPEISLHVDWQRKLLGNMSGQLSDRQIIACTHSPIIGANHTGRSMKLKLKRTTNPHQAKMNVVSIGG